MPSFRVGNDVRLILQSNLFILELHLFWCFLLQAVVFCHVHALTSAEASTMAARNTRLFRKVLLLDELQLCVG